MNHLSSPQLPRAQRQRHREHEHEQQRGERPDPAPPDRHLHRHRAAPHTDALERGRCSQTGRDYRIDQITNPTIEKA